MHEYVHGWALEDMHIWMGLSNVECLIIRDNFITQFDLKHLMKHYGQSLKIECMCIWKQLLFITWGGYLRCDLAITYVRGTHTHIWLFFLPLNYTPKSDFWPCRNKIPNNTFEHQTVKTDKIIPLISWFCFSIYVI